MKEILEQILRSEQLAHTCLWVPTIGQISGKIISVNDDIVVLDSAPNKNSGMYWTTVIRIDAIEVVDFRTDTRPLTKEERAEIGLSIEEEENTSE